MVLSCAGAVKGKMMSSCNPAETAPSRYDDMEEEEDEYAGMTPMERLMEQEVGALCNAEGISRSEMWSIQRLFLTHYRCHACKLLPLYRLDLSHVNNH
jgi:hypothetical protein